MNKKYFGRLKRQNKNKNKNQKECNASYLLPSPLGQAPPPAADPMAAYSPPQLMGGHMLPGPTPDPYEMTYSEPRYCPEPCPQECAPGCYDWCCYPSIQVPPPPMQLMMVPVNVSKPAAPPVPAPLPYPMTYGLNDACSPNPCPAKKHEVTKNTSLPLRGNAGVVPVMSLVVSKTSPAIQTISVTKEKSSAHPVEETKQVDKETSKVVEEKPKPEKGGGKGFKAIEVASNSKKSSSSSSLSSSIESKEEKEQHHVSKFVKVEDDDVDPEKIDNNSDEDDIL